MSLKQDVHDRLWRAFERWQTLRLTGVSKHDLKVKGIQQGADPNLHTRSLIFTGNTLRSYEGVLKDFVEGAQREQGAIRLEDIGKKEFRLFMDRAIGKGLALKTLNRYRSALAKFGALTGQTKSFAALSESYGRKIRGLAQAGVLEKPSRMTPSRDVIERAISILKDWDARHFARTDEPRAYHLAARIQLETAARSVSATQRVTFDSLKSEGWLELVGKGGKVMNLPISSDLYRVLSSYLAHNPGPLASTKGYQSAYARAILAAGGKITATHGARRRAVRDLYTAQYRNSLRAGLTPQAAARKAAGDAIEALGHSRHRRDHRAWYLGN